MIFVNDNEDNVAPDRYARPQRLTCEPRCTLVSQVNGTIIYIIAGSAALRSKRMGKFSGDTQSVNGINTTVKGLIKKKVIYKSHIITIFVYCLE